MAVSADLGETLESFVTKLVASGRYHSKSEVLREGVRLIQEREARLAALDASIARGLADVDAGRVKPSSEVFDRLETDLEPRRTAGKQSGAQERTRTFTAVKPLAPEASASTNSATWASGRGYYGSVARLSNWRSAAQISCTGRTRLAYRESRDTSPLTRF